MKDLLFGTAGIPLSANPRTTSDGIKHVKELGLGCMELEFVHSVNISKEKAPEIKKIAEENQEANLLMTIPGIAEIRAMEIIAEIGEINRFPTADKLCSYAGLVPSIKQSGNTLRFGKLIKQSSKFLKNAFVEASWISIRKDNPLQAFYKKLAKTKGKQKAICATARKMCCIVYAMLKNREEFRY